MSQTMATIKAKKKSDGLNKTMQSKMQTEGGWMHVIVHAQT
jgi:hypothetical protein